VHLDVDPSRNSGAYHSRVPRDAQTRLAVPVRLHPVSLAAWNLWASSQQPVLKWGGLTTPPDDHWTLATLVVACYGFLTFYVWV
jgi:hypothetical protein